MSRYALLLAVLAMAAASAGAAQQPSPVPQSGAISGVVIDANTNQPIGGAIVALGRTAQNPSPALPPRFTTDSKGRFIFPDLSAADDYYLSARASGYLSGAYGDNEPVAAIFFDRVTRIRLANGQWLPDLAIRLWRQPLISGRVVDERGEPLIGVVVRAFASARTAGYERLVGGPLATTDDRGIYSILDLTPGRYVVSVLSVQSTVLSTTDDAPPARAVGALQSGAISGGRGNAIRAPTIDVDSRHRLVVTNFATPPPPSVDRPRAYAAQFYPNARTMDSATVLDVAYGKEHLNIDFRLQPEPTYQIRGRTTGLSSPGLMLRLMPTGSEGLGFGSEAATTVVEADDSFAFLNVPAGTYTLVAQSSVMDVSVGNSSAWVPNAPGYPSGGSAVGSWSGAPGVSYLAQYGAGAKAWCRFPITVGQNVNGLEVPLRSTSKISGQIVFAVGVAPPKSLTGTDVNVEPANGDPLLWVGRSRPELVDGLFKFSVDVIAGVYLISGVSGYRVVSVTTAGRDLTNSGVDATLGNDISDVVITVTDKRNPSVSGSVNGPAGLRSAVLAFPASTDRWINYGWTARAFRVAPVGPDGKFSLTSLPAGDYLIAAIDAADFDRWPDPKFLSAVRTSATRVALDWGDVKTLDLQRR